MNNPLISILLPVYNTSAFLSQCLDSILAQTYANLQVVLVDDGSNDKSLDLCLQYASKDSRIEVYHQENQGVAAARNALLSHIKGDYFLFIDSDDWVEPNMVEFLISRTEKEHADMVVCGMVKNDGTPSSNVSEEKWTQEHAIKEFLRHINFNGSLCNKLINVTLLNKNPKFHREICYGEDALFCWELLKEAKTIIVTDYQLYHYRMNAASLSHLNWTPEKKGSGSITWSLISEDAAIRYPEYADIANARYAIEHMWGLYYASLANYPYNDEIAKRQKHVRDNLSLICHSGLVSKNKILFAWISSRWYGFGWALRLLRKFKGQTNQ